MAACGGFRCGPAALGPAGRGPGAAGLHSDWADGWAGRGGGGCDEWGTPPPRRRRRRRGIEGGGGWLPRESYTKVAPPLSYCYSYRKRLFPETCALLSVNKKELAAHKQSPGRFWMAGKVARRRCLGGRSRPPPPRPPPSKAAGGWPGWRMREGKMNERGERDRERERGEGWGEACACVCLVARRSSARRQALSPLPLTSIFPCLRAPPPTRAPSPPSTLDHVLPCACASRPGPGGCRQRCVVGPAERASERAARRPTPIVVEYYLTATPSHPPPPPPPPPTPTTTNSPPARPPRPARPTPCPPRQPHHHHLPSRLARL